MLRHFSFAGMQRCGNHAVIDWWMRHFKGWYFRNNIIGLNPKYKPCQTDTKGDYQNRVRIDSWENYDPASLTISHHSEPLIIIARDPYNWWASWYQYTWPNPNVEKLPREDTIEWYLRYFDYAADKRVTRFVCFNAWASNHVYRREIERAWNLPEMDDTGSQNAIGQEGSMRPTNIETVNERWKEHIHSPAYRDPILKYRSRFEEIAECYFNMEPPEAFA